MDLFKFDYLSKEGEQNMYRAKYVGSDNSLIYNYFYSPACGWLVDNVVPKWMSANLMTTFGLVFTIMGALVPAYQNYNNFYDGCFPWWTGSFIAFTTIGFCLWDNADGKKARKDGNASPLGMIYDHGLDTINGWLCTVPIAQLLQFGDLSPYFICSVMVAFNFQAMEVHALGAFNLGIVSGPAEGLLITSIIAIVGSYMPCGWFSTFVEGSTTFKRYDYVFYVYVVICSLTCLQQLYAIIQILRKEGKSLSSYTYLFLWPLYWASIYMYIVENSPAEIAKHYTHIFLFTFGFMHSSSQIVFLVKDVGKQDFQPFIQPAAFFAAMLFINTYFAAQGEPLVDELKFFKIMCLCTFINLCHVLYNLVRQFCKVLNIPYLAVYNKKTKQ